jgi:hypothetical protein
LGEEKLVATDYFFMSLESVCMAVEEDVVDEVWALSSEQAASVPMVRRARQQRMRFFIVGEFFATRMPPQGKKCFHL